MDPDPGGPKTCEFSGSGSGYESPTQLSKEVRHRMIHMVPTLFSDHYDRYRYRTVSACTMHYSWASVEFFELGL
jgi:hypothetical protein